MALDGRGSAGSMRALGSELRPVILAKLESLDVVVSECKALQRALAAAQSLCTALASSTAKIEGDTFAAALTPALATIAAAMRTMSDQETAVTNAYKELLR